MARPPRDIETERLVSFPLLCHAYLIVGGAQSLCCFLGWIWVYSHAGVKISDIFLLNPRESLWLSRSENNTEMNDAISNGTTFSPERQEEIVRQVRRLLPLPVVVEIIAACTHVVPHSS